ncbi:hypothetical protein JW835_07070 [bacterium]|nr:hypothetical protein [bacterium]
MSLKTRIEKLEKSTNINHDDYPGIRLILYPSPENIDYDKCLKYKKHKAETAGDYFGLLIINCIGCEEACKYAFDGKDMGIEERSKKAKEYWDSLKD